MLNCFNSSRVGLELVLYIKMAKIGPHFENEYPCLYLLYFFRVAYLTARDLASALQKIIHEYLKCGIRK